MRPELPILIKARAKIADPENWGKGARGRDRPRGTCCASEAIEESETVFNVRVAAYRAIGRVVAPTDDGIMSPLVEWNDAPERTHAEVLAAFDKAIASAS